MPISAEQCLRHLTDALRRFPADTYAPEALDWFAEVAGTVDAFNPLDSAVLKGMLPTISNTGLGIASPQSANHRQAICTQFRAVVFALATKLRLQTNAFTTAQIPVGRVYDYFEEVRGLVTQATNDVFFLDPYINEEFVSRYVPLVPVTCRVRLLSTDRTRAKLAPSVALYLQQSPRPLEVRFLPDHSLHDRHLVLDGARVFQSGASFKDGGKNSATSINEIVDTAAISVHAFEQEWKRGTP